MFRRRLLLANLSVPSRDEWLNDFHQQNRFGCHRSLYRTERQSELHEFSKNHRNMMARQLRFRCILTTVSKQQTSLSLASRTQGGERET